jgi:hypothetical protein
VTGIREPMPDVDLLRCPKCHSDNWRDIPDSGVQVRTKFACDRCGYLITIGACKKCRAKDWRLMQGIDKDLKGPRRPVYRLQCAGCGRKIGVIIGR